MNQHISLHRLQLLFRVFVAERGKTYLSSFGLIVAISLVLMLPILFKEGYHDLLYVLHAFALFCPVMLGGSLFTSTAFSQYHNNDQGIAAIMLPASQLEKFLIILVAHIIFMVSILLVFWNLHLWTTELANATIPPGYRRYNTISPKIAEYFVFLYVLIQVIIFLGSIYFSKQVFIKSLVVILIVGLVATLLHLGLAYQLTGISSQINSLPFMAWTIIKNGQRSTVAFPEVTNVGIRILLGFVVVTLMLTAYVRLREKEI
jgi:hypothetical protein